MQFFGKRASRSLLFAGGLLGGLLGGFLGGGLLGGLLGGCLLHLGGLLGGGGFLGGDFLCYFGYTEKNDWLEFISRKKFIGHLPFKI